MATEVKLPRLGQGMESGTIVKWLKGEGEPVKKGEPLYELDTDKVTQEVEAEADGVLLKIVVDSGEVEVGKTIAFIGSEGEDVPLRERRRAGRSRASRGRGRRRGRAESRRRRARRAERDGRRARARPCRPPPRPPRPRPRQSPTRPRGRRPRQGLAARAPARAREGHRARDAAAAAGRRAGSSPRTSSAARPAPQAAPAAAGAAAAGEVEEIALTSTRKTIARRLTEAWQAPVFQLTRLRRHDARARAARAARRPAARGRDEADRERPADEGRPRPRSCATPP